MKDSSSDVVQYNYQNLNELAELMDGKSLLGLILSDDPFHRSDICKACGGICCKMNACSAIPQDFNSDIGDMESCISTGKYSISYICRRGFTPTVHNERVMITKKSILRHRLSTSIYHNAVIQWRGKGTE